MAGWKVLAAWVLSYDAWALRNGRPTMSAAYYAWYTHVDPTKRRFIKGVTIYLIMHLAHLPNDRFAILDPLAVMAKVIHQKT